MDVRALTPSEAATIAGWRYPDRYSTYAVDDPAVLAGDHWAVEDEDALLGYCCFGAPARVEGGGEEPGVLDLGYGMAPERMGSGLGPTGPSGIPAPGAHSPSRTRTAASRSPM